MAFGETKQAGITKRTGWSYEGKPITLTKKRGQKFEKPRHKQGWYSENTKVQAATIYAATRDLKAASELAGVPVGRVKSWRAEPWFQNVVDRCVKDNNDQLDAALTDIIHECKDQIKDRLKHGNHQIVHKTGEIIQIPLPARELTMTLAILFDKRQLIRGEATSRTESVNADQRLKQLAAQFEKFSKATEIEGVFIDESEIQQEESQGQGSGQDTPALLEYEMDSPDTGDDGTPSFGTVVSEVAESTPSDTDSDTTESGSSTGLL